MVEVILKTCELRKQTDNAKLCGGPQVPFLFWMMGKISKNLESEIRISITYIPTREL